MRFYGWMLAVLFTATLQAQPFHPAHHRILFILDASGSMAAKWNGSTRFDIARNTLFALVDSLENTSDKLQFGLRIFGSQFPKAQRNCTDSKLFIPFASKNAATFRKTLSHITPQGMTPIAYSIAEGAKDFPQDTSALNAIIFITDGNENCDGEPCAGAAMLLEKHISLKPFIIGVDVAAEAEAHFQCMGSFINTRSSGELKNAVGVIVTQTLNNTSAQINLLDRNEQNAVTNIPISLVNRFHKKTAAHFIHTQREPGISDTLFLDPTGVYELTVHSFPEVKQNDLTLSVGRNNVFAAKVPLAGIRINTAVQPGLKSDSRILIRADDQRFQIQERNKTAFYLEGKYRIQALTTPVTDTSVNAAGNLFIAIPAPGTVVISTKEKCRAAIILQTDSGDVQVQLLETFTEAVNLKLQPGTYTALVQPLQSTRTDQTRSVDFLVEENKTLVLEP